MLIHPTYLFLKQKHYMWLQVKEHIKDKNWQNIEKEPENESDESQHEKEGEQSREKSKIKVHLSLTEAKFFLCTISLISSPSLCNKLR